MSKAQAPAAPRFEVAVDPLGLDAAATMRFVVDRRRRQDEAAAEEMRAVSHWADLHRIGDDEVGSIDDEVAAMLFPVGADDRRLGREGELRLAGQGAFMVTEFAICEVAAALGLSEPAARAYVGRTIELRDRLPRLWAGVMRGRLPAWKGRKIAAQTIPLSASAADYVDRQLAAFAHKLSMVRITTAVDAAVQRHDPELAAEHTARAAERRGVWLDDCVDGVSEIRAVTDTPDALAFDTALNQVAAGLQALGDESSEQARRARAVGVLADPQRVLELQGTSDSAASETPVRQRRTRPGPTIHVHLHTDAVSGFVAEKAPAGAAGHLAGAAGHLARVDGHGAQTLETVQRWLAALAPGAAVTVTPVVDLNEHISVNAYEAPDRLRSQVGHRDDCCRFPWCGRRGVFDLDHIIPFLPPHEGGRPGQTSSTNLARLCRFHHRVKTHGGWDYERDPGGSVTWSSPLGRRYTVDEHGTLPRP